jgi:sugar phosphate isomerase/epimerase
MTLYVSTLNFGLNALTQLGALRDGTAWPAVEISSGHPYEPGIAAWLRRQASSRALLLHNFVPLTPEPLLINLADPDPARRSAVQAFLREAIELTSALRAEYYSFHAGYRVPYQFGRKAYEASERMTEEEALDRFIEALREVVAFAESLGVHLGVENHIVEAGNEDNLILYEPEQFARLFEAVGSPWLHLHFDTGHWKVTSRTMGLPLESFLPPLRERVLAVHLHDNDGRMDQHLPFGADAWFLDELPRLAALRYACLETAAGGDAGRIQELIELVQGRLPVGQRT